MPIPTAPTDNLYKFFALSGVAMMIAGIGLPLLTLRDFRLRAVESHAEAMLYAADTEFDEQLRDMERVEVQHRESEMLLEVVRSDGGHTVTFLDDGGVKFDVDLEIRRDAERQAKLLVRMRQTRERGRLLAALEGRVEALKDLGDEFLFVAQWGYRLALLGLLVAAVGFWRWFALYQLPMDLLARAQIQEAKKKIAEIKSAAVPPVPVAQPPATVAEPSKPPPEKPPGAPEP